MGDEQGDRFTPLLVYWKIYQSDQLEEVGVYWKRDSKNPCIGRQGRVVQNSWDRRTWVLIGQRVKHFGIAIDLRNTYAFWIGRWHEICLNKDCCIIPPSLVSSEYFYQHTTRRHLWWKEPRNHRSINILLPLLTLFCFILHPTSSFAAVIISTATRVRRLIRNVCMGRNNLL